MGTRSITRVLDESNNVILTMISTNGWLLAHGVELVKFLKDFNIVNGIGRDIAPKTANGMGRLAAQLVSYFKTGVGEIYLVSKTDEEEEYNYTISLRDEILTLTYVHGDKSGTLLPINTNTDSLDKSQEVVEFLYPDKYFENQWRKILVISRDDRYITGFDLKNNNQVKRFLLEKVFGGEDKIFRSNK